MVSLCYFCNKRKKKGSPQLSRGRAKVGAGWTHRSVLSEGQVTGSRALNEIPGTTYWELLSPQYTGQRELTQLACPPPAYG